MNMEEGKSNDFAISGNRNCKVLPLVWYYTYRSVFSFSFFPVSKSPVHSILVPLFVSCHLFDALVEISVASSIRRRMSFLNIFYSVDILIECLLVAEARLIRIKGIGFSSVIMTIHQSNNILDLLLVEVKVLNVTS